MTIYRRKFKIKLKHLKFQLKSILAFWLNRTKLFLSSVLKFLKPLWNLLKRICHFARDNYELSFIILVSVFLISTIHIYLRIEKINEPIITEINLYDEDEEHILIRNHSDYGGDIKLSKTKRDEASSQIIDYINFNTDFNFKHSWVATQPFEYTVYYNKPITNDNIKDVKQEAYRLLKFIAVTWGNIIEDNLQIRARLLVDASQNNDIVIYIIENF